MSIILRDDRSFGGTAYPAGTTLSLDGALEANLVAQGLATWAGQAPYQGGATQTVQLAVDDRGNVTGLVGRNGTAGFVDAGLFGASPDASAAVNTAAIQAALDVGGVVTLNTPGEYLINRTLRIGSNTTFICRGRIKLADASNCVMLANRHAQSIVDIEGATISGGYITVPELGHNRADGEEVYVEGMLGNSGLNGKKSVVNSIPGVS